MQSLNQSCNVLGGECFCPSPNIEEESVLGRACDTCPPGYFVNVTGCTGKTVSNSKLVLAFLCNLCLKLATAQMVTCAMFQVVSVSVRPTWEAGSVTCALLVVTDHHHITAL